MTQSEWRDEPESAAATWRAPEPPPVEAQAAFEPDRVTIERAAHGDLRAFETLYRGSAGRVNALCLRLAGWDRARAQDFVQEVYLRVWERLGTFEGRSKFSTWLHRLAINRVTDLMRMEIRRSLLEAIDENAASVPSRAASPGAGLDLEAGIASLPAGARIVFVLHDVEGYGHEEIAAMTGVSIGTSKSQLHRARRLLRQRLSR